MKIKPFQIILALSIVFFVILFSYLSHRRYLTLNSYYYDLGIMNQVVDNTSRGHFLEMTNQQLKKNLNRMSIHFDPILAAFAPFYLVYRSPAVLLFGQVLVVSLGSLAVYLIARAVIKKAGIALLFALSYLFYFQIQRMVLFDFHAVALATSFLLFAFYFRLMKKRLPYFIFIFLSLLTKEHVGLVVFMYGLYLMFFSKDKRTGTLTAAAGVLFFVLAVGWVIPYFRQESHFALRYFEEFGDSPLRIFLNIFAHPLLTLKKIFSQDSINYVIRLFTPLPFIVFSPLTLIIALPEMLINMLSINGNMRSFFFHYSAISVAVLFYSAILGYRSFCQLTGKRKAFVKAAVFLFVVLNGYSFYLYNPWPKGLVRSPVEYKDIDPIKKKSLDILVTKFENDRIRLSTTPRLAPFFTHRRYYHNFLFDTAYLSAGQTDEEVLKNKLGTYQGSDYVIIDKEEIGNVDSGSLSVKFYQHLRANEDYVMIASDDWTIEVYAKKNIKSPIIEDPDI